MIEKNISQMLLKIKNAELNHDKFSSELAKQIENHNDFKPKIKTGENDSYIDIKKNTQINLYVLKKQNDNNDDLNRFYKKRAIIYNFFYAEDKKILHYRIKAIDKEHNRIFFEMCESELFLYIYGQLV